MHTRAADRQGYDWTRFWCPREGTFSLADGGYLVDPLTESGRSLNPQAVPLQAVIRVPCLVLLGEPGMGKSTAMRTQKDDLNQQIAKAGGTSLWIDLRQFQSDVRLYEQVFRHPTVEAWKQGTHTLHLFLDSLDECLLRVNVVAALLAEQLQELPVERLFLRIACRTGEWPHDLEVRLRSIWGEGYVGVLELTPLRRVDVEQAAEQEGIVSADFLAEVARREAVPLAIKPVTLRFLLNTYRRQGMFPARQAALYYEGCRLLCEETNESRRGARLTGNLSAEQRLALAARVAAITVFGNRYAVWAGPDQGEVPEADATLREICRGSETGLVPPLPVTEAALQEVLSTGLFSSRGEHRIGWAHQTFAEFLAAHYLVSHGLNHLQLSSLILHPGDAERRVVPQLREAAAWLAGMVPEIFRDLSRTDPEVLLRSDLSTVDARDQQQLVQALLALYEEERSFDTHGFHQYYRKLAHPGLADQLRPYLRDKSKNVRVRRVAADLAEACELTDLEGELVEVALDPQEEQTVRVNAAYALARIGSEAARRRLLPLAWEKAGEDPDDELKGGALLALWPNLLSARQLFPLLTPPKNPHLLGAYKSFLWRELKADLSVSDLPYSLQWVATLGPVHGIGHSFEEATNAMMQAGWEHFEDPSVRRAFVRAAATRLKHHDPIIGGAGADAFHHSLQTDDAKRRLLLEAVVGELARTGTEPGYLVFGQSSLLSHADLPWLIERLLRSRSKARQQAWVLLIRLANDWHDPDHFEAIAAASRKNALLFDAFATDLTPVTLGSPDAEKMRADYERYQEYQRSRAAPPVLDPLPTVRIQQRLEKFEAGDWSAWWMLNLDLTLEPNSSHYGEELQSDLTQLPGWQAADDPTRTRLLDAARVYLLKEDPKASEWFCTNTIYRPAFAGYRALRLLLQEAPDLLQALPDSVWIRWAPIILQYPTSSEGTDHSVQRQLVALAYQHAPEAIIAATLAVVEQENQQGNGLWVLRKLPECWDERLAQALLSRAKANGLLPGSLAELLGTLLDRQTAGAVELAHSLVLVPLPEEEEARSRMLPLVATLFLHAPEGGWSRIWPLLQADPSFGRSLIEFCVDELRHESAPFTRLNEDQLADLYQWLVGEYPPVEDPRELGAHMVGPRESLAHWRDSIVGHLKQRGTPAAVAALSRLTQELPDLPWLKLVLHEAQENLRRLTWTPPEPEYILRLAENRQARLVESGEELLAVLTEQLRELQAKFHGETPAVRDIWDYRGNNVFRPVDENTFSDYVKRFLEERLEARGVVLNREVVIRAGFGSARGERTDIHVDAVRQRVDGSYDTITVVIEVKGCWHRELSTAMESQLIQRYLANNKYRHGLYMVGWFVCPQWDSTDSRLGGVPRLTMEEARENFISQAKVLSHQYAVSVEAVVLNTALTTARAE